jgi:hypothetical protein
MGKNNRKFRIGDRVVVAQAEYYKGWTGEIIDIFPNVIVMKPDSPFSNNQEAVSLFPYRYEFEAVHDSPLYNALQEDFDDSKESYSQKEERNYGRKVPRGSKKRAVK